MKVTGVVTCAVPMSSAFFQQRFKFGLLLGKRGAVVAACEPIKCVRTVFQPAANHGNQVFFQPFPFLHDFAIAFFAVFSEGFVHFLVGKAAQFQIESFIDTGSQSKFFGGSQHGVGMYVWLQLRPRYRGHAYSPCGRTEGHGNITLTGQILPCLDSRFFKRIRIIRLPIRLPLLLAE